MYEASQHTIITRKPVFPSSAGGCRTVSTVGSSPQNCQIGAEPPKNNQMVKDGKERSEAKPSNPITIRPGSLTPVELTPPPSATTTRAASLSKYSILDFLAFSFTGGYFSLCPVNILPICAHLVQFCSKRTASVKSPCLHDIISFLFYLSFHRSAFL